MKRTTSHLSSMTCNRMLLLHTLLLLLFACAARPAAAQQTGTHEWQVSDSLTVAEIAPGVWMHTSWHMIDGGLIFPTNGLLVRDGDALTLIDTAWGVERTEELLDWTEAQIGLPVTLAIVTHFHDDSMGGSPVLAARGIPFVGHPLTSDLAADTGIPLPDSVADLQVGDAMMVANVEVFYPGPGHSEDNLVVWVPEAQVLFGSCAVKSPAFPGKGNTEDADLAEWPVSIRRVLDRYPTARIVIPGHGDVGDTELLSYTIGLFQE